MPTKWMVSMCKTVYSGTYIRGLHFMHYFLYKCMYIVLGIINVHMQCLHVRRQGELHIYVCIERSSILHCMYI